MNCEGTTLKLDQKTWLDKVNPRLLFKNQPEVFENIKMNNKYWQLVSLRYLSTTQVELLKLRHWEMTADIEIYLHLMANFTDIIDENCDQSIFETTENKLFFELKNNARNLTTVWVLSFGNIDIVYSVSYRIRYLHV